MTNKEILKKQIFYRSAHPYTLGLKEAMPTNDPNKQRELKQIEGSPPDLFSAPAGWGYCARCPFAMQICDTRYPDGFFVEKQHSSCCWLHHKDSTRRPEELYFKGNDL